MGKPRMIIVIRHAQSEGNKNRDIHQTIPDHRVKLTPDGVTQAHEAGRRLRSMLRSDDTLHFFTSPYRRTRETTEGILSTLTANEPSPSPFHRDKIKVYEEPRLREQDFGNFQPCSAEMERMWQERADYGHFFYRIPNGESAADAYDRVSGFNESLWRQFGEEDFASVCVLVTHGLMSRVFLMKWYHFSVEYFEDLRNVNHCEFLIMRRQADSGKYLLENTLRTWSQLKRDRAAQKEREKDNPHTTTAVSDKDKEKEAKVGLNKPPDSPIPNIPFRKRWGGCPNGCDHSRHQRKDNSMHPMQSNFKPPASSASPPTQTSAEVGSLVSRRPAATRRWQSSSGSGSDNDSAAANAGDDPRGRAAPAVDVQKSNDDVVSSPDGTPSFISIEDRLKNRIVSPGNPLHNDSLLGGLRIRAGGRDFGGSVSGKSSRADSDCDTDLSPDEHAREKMMKHGNNSRCDDGSIPGKLLKSRPAALAKENSEISGGTNDLHGKGNTREESRMGRDTRADALGDKSDGEAVDGEIQPGMSEIDYLEQMDMDAVMQAKDKEEQSVAGSVL